MQRICHLILLVAVVAVGCADRPAPRAAAGNPDDDTGVGVKDVVKAGLLGDKLLETTPVSKTDDVLAALPDPTKKEMAEARMLKAIDLMAEDKYGDALKELEEAQKIDDSGPIQREITKAQAVLAQREGASRAVSDVQSVLEDGKPEEAAKLAASALGSYGGGDHADDLTRLAQQAEAEVTAAADNVAARGVQLRDAADAALKEDNLRAAAIALEQVQQVAPAADDGRRLDDLRDKLRVYDESRAKAAALRRDPTRVGEAVEHLQTAAKVWPTLQVRQQIDEYRLVLERRRDRLAVAPFEIRADLGFPAAGETVAEGILPHFKRRFDLVERGQLTRLADEMKLETASLFESNAGRRELGDLAKVRYMVVGSVSPVGGITVQARLVEVATGLIVQTARVSAATLEELQDKRLEQLAVMLQMNDDEKAAFEVSLRRSVPVVEALPATPLTELPPPPPPPEEAAVIKVPPIVTMSAAPMPLGGIMVEDFQRLPPPVFITALAPPPPPPPPLVVALEAQPERRHRLLRLSLEVGDNLFRRGRVQEAQRHFGLAFSLAGPRREISLRLDACRAYAPPPPPPVMVVAPRPVIVVPPPIAVGFAPPPPPPPPVVMVAPVRPRLAVFGFVPGLPTMVPPGATEALADQLASYMGGSYEIVDRGEVCWYMGRLGLTMREVLNDPTARRCLAQSLGARYFVFGTLTVTGSFDVDTHLFDAETNARTATANIHVQDHDEMKLRLGELAHQLGAKPEDKKAIAAAGAASEKALKDARSLLASDPAGAKRVAAEGLTASPDSVALRSLVADADKRIAQTQVRAQRDAEAAKAAAASALAKKRQAELAVAAAAAKATADAEARSRGEAEKRVLAERRAKASETLRVQAKAAEAKGDSAAAVKLLQSASSLRPSDDVFKELASARSRADVESKARAAAAHRAAVERAQREREAIQAKLDAAKAKHEAEVRATREAKAAHDRAVADGFLTQARAAFDRKEYARAADLSGSARRVMASAEAADLHRRAEDALTLEKAGAAERVRLAEQQKRAAVAEAAAKAKQREYQEALTKAQALVKAGKYAEAEHEYQAAGKLFNTPVVGEGLKAVSALAAQEKHAADEAKRHKYAEETKANRVRALAATAAALSAKGEHAAALRTYREAAALAPGDAAVAASLHGAEVEAARATRLTEAKRGQAEALKLIAAGRAQMGAKRYEAAADSFRRALVQDATNAEARSLLGQAEKMTSPKAVRKTRQQEDYELAMDAGRGALAAGNAKGATNAYSQALKIMPGDAAAAKGLADAQARERTGMAAERTRAYETAMRSADALLAGRKFREAFAAYDDALKVRPGDALAIAGKRKAEAAMTPTPDPKRAAYDAALRAGRAALDAGKYGEAVKHYDDALRAEPGDRAAIDGKAAAMRHATDVAYRGHLSNGQKLLAAKRFKEAEAAFDQALKLRPGDAEAARGRREAEAATKTPPVSPKKVAYDRSMAAAAASAKAGQFAEALRHYDEALVATPGDAAAVEGKRAMAYRVHFCRGEAALDAKQFREAAAEFDEALKLRPGDPAATSGRRASEAGMRVPEPKKTPAADREVQEGNAALKAGRYAEALRHADEALRTMPGDKAALDLKAVAVARVREAAYAAHVKNGAAQLAGHKYAEAMASYDEALKLRPGDADAIQGKRAAQAGLRPATPPKGKDPLAEFNRQIGLGQTLEKAGKVGQALNAYRGALAAVAGDAGHRAEQARAYAGMGRCHHAARDFDDAMREFEEALKRTPDDAAVRAALAAARMKR